MATSIHRRNIELDLAEFRIRLPAVSFPTATKWGRKTCVCVTTKLLGTRSPRVSPVSTLLITAGLNLRLNDSGTPRLGFGPGADLVPARSCQRPATPLRLPLPASPYSRLLSSEVPGLVAGQLCGTCGTAPCLGLAEEFGTEESVSLWAVALLFVLKPSFKPLGWLGDWCWVVWSSSVHFLRQQVAHRIGSSTTCSFGASVPCPSHEPTANKPLQLPFPLMFRNFRDDPWRPSPNRSAA